MTETSLEQLCQGIMDQVGFLVVGTEWPEETGAVLGALSSGRMNLGFLNHKTVVIGEAAHSDWVRQASMAGLPANRKYPFYYKVIAE